jgi:PTH2 family peptidyl-tRNA hydrolase
MSNELRMALIFRGDIKISKGKACAQAGHATLAAFRGCTDPELIDTYMATGQAKLVFLAPDLETLQKVATRATKRGVSAALIEDEGRTEFTGPTYTVLGLGPMNRTDYNNLTKGIPLMKEDEKERIESGC